MQQRPLLDLLGARWALGAAVVAAAWDAAGAVAGFALADGTLALAPRTWPGAARVASRPSGGIELVPATAPPGPVTRTKVQGGCRGIAAAPGGGFATLGTDGTLAWTAADGASRPPPAADLPGGITAIAGAPDAATLALGHAGGISLVAAQGCAPLAAGDPPQALACAGGRLAAWTRAGALQVWPTPASAPVVLAAGPARPGSLAIFDAAGWLAAAGDVRPVCWRLGPPAGAAVSAGLAGRNQVTAVAGHPSRALLATGHANGAILLCQPPGDAAVLFLRAPDGHAVAALAWSGDGKRLALGTATGEIAVLALPAALFRPREAAA